jgi:hypothetical protein
MYLKNEIDTIVPWRVEILNESVAAEIAALPADMQARFLRLADRIAATGLQSLSEPHVKHLEDKLWELRLTGRDGNSPRPIRHRDRAKGRSGSSFRQEITEDAARRKSNSRYGGPRKSDDNSVRQAQGSPFGQP